MPTRQLTTVRVDDVPQGANWRRQVAWVALLTITVNAPFWVLSQWYYLQRPLISLDLIAAIALWSVNRRLGCLAIVACWGLEGVVSQAGAFHFASVLEFVRSLRFAGSLSLYGLLSPALLEVALLFLACAVIGYAMAERASYRARTAWILALAVAILDAVNGSSVVSPGGTQLLAVNLSGSPLASVTLPQLLVERPRNIEALPARHRSPSSTALHDWARSEPDAGILYVIVESWGQPVSPVLGAWLKRQLMSTDMTTRYTLQTESLHSEGSTTDGELRSLCGLRGSYTQLVPTDGSACLPAELARLGWQTAGVHGFTSRMFDRQHWWPSLGLQETAFAEALLDADQPRCGGVFRGACDADVIAWGVDRAAKPRHFVYVLTLNSHLPLTGGLLDPELQAICATEQIEDAPCELVEAVGKTLRAVSQSVRRLATRPAVLLVGDHPPPFRVLKHRMRFEQKQVPEWLLLPRQSQP